MFFLFGRKSKMRRVSGGRQEKRRCPECEENALFVEHDRASTYTAYLVELWDSSDRVFVCGNCGEAMDLEDTSPPAPSAAERAKLARAAADEAERAAKQRAAERKVQEKQIDAELAALKRKLRDG